MTGDQLQAIIERLNLPRPIEPWWPAALRDSMAVLNHATALVELVRACEARQAARCTDGGYDDPDSCNYSHTGYCQLGKAERAEATALKAVHAVAAVRT